NSLKKLEEYKILNGDTLLHGTSKEYYENGNLRLKSLYNMGLLDGKQYGYFENGTMNFEVTWLNGFKDGKWKFYYNDPEKKLLEYKAFFYQDSLAYHQFAYHKNQVVSKYSFENPFISGYIYLSSYDKNGNLIMEDGDKNPYIFVPDDINNGMYYFGDTLYYYVFYPIPPHIEVELYAKMDVHEEWYELQLPNDKYQTSVFYSILKDVGKFSLKAKLVVKKGGETNEYLSNPFKFEVHDPSSP
ncbi:MAG: hypothetical protein EA412_14595, partial [Chitinophagaceae bacterium]